MTNMQLLDAIGMIDESTILDAEQPVAKVLPSPRARFVRQITVIAACICLLFGSAVAAQMGGWSGKGGATEPGAPQDGEPTYAAGAETTSAPEDGMTAATTAGATATTTVAATTTAATTKVAGEAWTTTTTAWTSGAAQPTYTYPPTTTTTRATYTGTTTVALPEVEIPVADLWVYSEDFNGYSDTELTSDISSILDWHKLTVKEDNAYSESNAAFAIRDGRLYFDNMTPEGSGKDGYYAIDLLNDDYMEYIAIGKYTLQYDLEYINAANVSRYAVIITELSEDGQCYNSFHLRISGIANHQCHFYGSWKTYSAYDPATDLNPSADDPTGAEGTSLVSKLLGLDIAQVSEQMNLKNVRLTVRLQWDPEMGHHVYLKTADMADFIKVSAPSVNADGPMYMGWDGWYVALKLGGGIEGYLDNIHIWTGWGEEPSADAKWYQPR